MCVYYNLESNFERRFALRENLAQECVQGYNRSQDSMNFMSLAIVLDTDDGLSIARSRGFAKLFHGRRKSTQLILPLSPDHDGGCPRAASWVRLACTA